MNKIQIFFIGILAAIGALVFEILLSIIFPNISSSENSPAINAYFILAIFIEEIIKFTFLWRISRNLNSSRDIFLSALFLGSGFATTEILFNLANNLSLDLNLFLSYLGLFLIHVSISSLYGLYFSQKNGFSRWSAPVIFALGIFFHFLFNFSIFHNLNQLAINGCLLILLLLLFFVGFLAKKEKLN